MKDYVIQYENTLALPAGGQTFATTGELVIRANKASEAAQKAETLLGPFANVWSVIEAAIPEEKKVEEVLDLND